MSSNNNFDQNDRDRAEANRKQLKEAQKSKEGFDITVDPISVDIIMARPKDCFGSYKFDNPNYDEGCEECKDLAPCKLETAKEERDTPLTPEQEELRMKLGAFGILYLDTAIVGFTNKYPKLNVLKKDGFPSIKFFEFYLGCIDQKQSKLLRLDDLNDDLRKVLAETPIVEEFPTKEAIIKSLAEEENMKNRILVQELRDENAILSNSNDVQYAKITELQDRIDQLENYSKKVVEGIEVMEVNQLDYTILRKMIPEFVRVAKAMKEITKTNNIMDMDNFKAWTLCKESIVIDTNSEEDTRILELLAAPKPVEAEKDNSGAF